MSVATWNATSLGTAPSATTDLESQLNMSDGLKRRDFLKVAGVSGAGAGVLGCSTEKVERLLPYVVPPEEITPGVATWYTTVCGECEAGCGMWVRTREGRGAPDVRRGGLPAYGSGRVFPVGLDV